MECPNCKRYRDALVVASEAMEERRHYADGWEWKYGAAWDEEDSAIDAILAPNPEDLGETPLFVEGV
jgi:hypothetical protein